jgi:hypothetical protein
LLALAADERSGSASKYMKSFHSKYVLRSLLATLLLGLLANTSPAQQKTPAPRRPPNKGPKNTTLSKDARIRFAADALQMAVQAPANDPQDRLRVLLAAIPVASSVNRKLLPKLVQEGAELETRLITSGQKPAGSVLESAQVGCGTAQNFVEALAPTTVYEAEQSLLGALGSCAKTLDSVRYKLEAGMKQNVVAPRALMAAMDASGLKSDWTARAFEEVFSSLPKDKDQARAVAPDVANVYAHAAPEVAPELAAKTGVQFLEWLNSVPEGNDRNLAVNVTTETMRKTLGEKKYDEALATNVMARQVAQTEGQPGEVERNPEENVSVLQAMRNKEDRTMELSEMEPSMRARQAAAYGFARGTEGDPAKAETYFETAFSAADAAWSQGGEHDTGAAVVAEVCEAAAHVDPVSALRRAQHLQASAAQAIGMLAVARIVLTRQEGIQPVQAANAGPRQ